MARMLLVFLMCLLFAYGVMLSAVRVAWALSRWGGGL